MLVLIGRCTLTMLTTTVEGSHPFDLDRGQLKCDVIPSSEFWFPRELGSQMVLKQNQTYTDCGPVAESGGFRLVVCFQNVQTHSSTPRQRAPGSQRSRHRDPSPARILGRDIQPGKGGRDPAWRSASSPGPAVTSPPAGLRLDVSTQKTPFSFITLWAVLL